MIDPKRISATALCLTGAAMCISPAAAENATYEVDPGHTSLYFKVDHLGFSQTFGRFNTMAGSLEFDPDDPASGSFNLTIDANSVDTNHQERDDHLRSPDFFNTGEFPEITFASTAIEVTGDNTGTVTGDFTMLGVTQPVSMDVTFNTMAPYPFVEGQTRIGFSATGSLNRGDFGMTYGSDGIGNDITLFVEVEAFR